MPKRSADDDLFTNDLLTGDLLEINDLWNPPPSPYTDNPVLWMKDRHAEIWSKQKEIMMSVAKNRYTTVKSCHGPGKSYIASRIIAWWLDQKKDPFVVTSAPTSHQVRTILWREIARAKKQAHLPGVISQGQVPEWKIAGELVGFGRKPADYLDPVEAAAAFQGIHALSLLVVLDEGSGIPDWLANACENLITNEESRLLVIGNPDDPFSWFAKTWRKGSGFNQIKIAAKDTPNFTGEPISSELARRLVSKVWVEERKKRWGEKSPMYLSKVDAEFPTVTDDTVFTPSIINRAIITDRSAHAIGEMGRYGFDVARLGPDESVVYHNRRGYVRLVKKWAKRDTMQTVGEYRRLVKERPDLAAPCVIDMVGLGAGPYDRLRELGYTMIGFNGGERAYNAEKYKNRRSESYWEARDAMEEGLVDLDELDEELMAELYEIHFKMTSTGQIQVEPKDDISQRLGRSPDRADAFVMSLQMMANLQHMAMEEDNRTPDGTEPPKEFDDEAAEIVGDVMEVKF